MSSIILQTTSNKNNLPDDIFDHNHDKFYEIIGRTYGVDLANLISFQSIRNGEHLLEASSDDILLILGQESEDLNALKKMCCFQVVGNKYEVKLGVKLALNKLIQALKTKQEEQQKKKRRSTKRLPSLFVSLDAEASTNETQIEISSPTSSLAVPFDNSTSSKESPVMRIQKKSNEIAHKLDIEQRINKWWCSVNDREDLYMNEGRDYYLEINKSLNNTYACILSCNCGIRFKLPFLTPGFFKLSAFYRHIKEQQCVKIAETVSVF
jgi:hypothetical protein